MAVHRQDSSHGGRVQGAFDVRHHFPASLCGGPVPVKRDYRGLINLSSNELDHPLLAEVFSPQVLRDLIDQSISRYPDPADTIKAVSAACGVPPECAVLSAGSDDAIKAVMWLTAPVSQRMIIQSPNYGGYLFHAVAAGGDPTRVEVFGKSASHRYHALADQVSTSACVVVTDPDPVEGVTIGPETMRSLATWCESQAALLIIDATYASFAGVDYLPLAVGRSNVIVIRSFSKSHGLAGARVAGVVAAPDIIAVLRRFRLSNAVSKPTLELLAHALSQPRVWSEIWSDVRQWRDALAKDLRGRFADWTIKASDTNFVLVDTHSSAMARRIVDRLEEHDIVVKSFFDLPEIASCLRISVTAPETAAAFLETLDRVV